jgi:PAS domain S-box-containing protein
MKPIIAADTILSLCALLAGILLLALRRQKGIGYASTFAYATCLFMGATSRIILSQVSDAQTTNLLEIIISFMFGYLPAFVLLFTLGFITQNKRSIFRNIFLLAAFPVLVMVVFAVQSIPGLLSSGHEAWDFSMIASSDTVRLLIPVYSLGMLVAALTLVISKSNQNLKFIQNRPMFWLGIAICLALILVLVSLGNPAAPFTASNLILTGYLLIGVAFLFTRQKISQTILITREELFDGFSDGIVVINNDDVILDMNPAAEQLVGIPAQRAYGNPVELILANWKSISGSNEAKEIEFKGSINLNRQWRYISVRTNKLDDERGRVIILRDITDRRDTREARQHAREEMFNLLRSFFKSANTSQSSNDFFRDVLFQVAYTFRADSGAICLVESPQDARKLKYILMANHGTLVKDKDALSGLFTALEPLGWSHDTPEPLIITDAGQNDYFANWNQEFTNFCIAVLPLLYNEQLMGVLILSRTEGAGFHSDEIVRLGVVTEELASFIYSDRKRKADIALAERHRLTQDLHDSITQKLVGLLQLTEAVKLGLESGAPVDGKRIDRISESARQALREMRLFLFELAPVDIERDGLISILQSRLASVEGRSDIQARMIADSEIILTTQEETEIYYIVEEALNNILKHANAKSVFIKLKKRKESIYLEIVDNGCGFDLKNVKYGGKGLGNIRDRAKRIKGKLKITSSPENGTKITLVVPQ